MPWKLKLKKKPYRLINDDCIQAMKLLPDNSVDAVICDPPYNISVFKNIGSQKEDWDNFESHKAYQKYCYKWAKQALRVLKPGAFLLVFNSTKNYHWMATGVCAAGFVCYDMMQWLYSSAMPHGKNIGKATKLKQYEGTNTQLRPSQEPIGVFQKPISEKSITANVLRWGTGCFYIDKCRIPTKDKLGRRNKKGKTNTLYSINRENHSTEQSVYINNSDNKGRYPGNVILSHNIDMGDDKYGPITRYFYCSKASKIERNAGLIDIENKHISVKPLELMRYLVKLITPIKGRVLDCFMGSGSTGVACMLESMCFIGIEKDQRHFNIAKQRVKYGMETKNK